MSTDTPAVPELPSGYAYEYPDYRGGTVIRMSHGEEINGSQPIRAIPYYLQPAVDRLSADLATAQQQVRDLSRELVANGDHWQAQKEALERELREARKLLTDWRVSIDMVRGASVDSEYYAKMILNGVEQRMYEYAQRHQGEGNG